MKHYADSNGQYLGGWDANPPSGAVEVPSAPVDARQKWSGSAWSAVDESDLTDKERKLKGVLFDGVMCSATKEDMWGLAAVYDYVAAGGTANFQFDNGNTITLTQANYQSFQAIWTPFRASFF